MIPPPPQSHLSTPRFPYTAPSRSRPIEALPEYCRPATTAQAYAIQDAVADLLGPVGGWKVGAKGPDAQPNCAPLPATHVIEVPAQFPSREFPLRGIEAERSEEHTSELQSLMRNPYAVLCLKK